MSEELVKREPMALGSLNPEGLIAHAIEHGTDVSVMKELLAMRAALRAENAKAEYDRAMAAFQAECPIIVKTKKGAKGYYKYAPLEDIIEQTRKLMHDHGFSFSISSAVENGWVKALCRVTHQGGHSEVGEFKCPIDSNRENAMSEPQRYGAALTFCRRYALCNAFGILTADQDTDAGSGTKPQGPSSLAADVTVKDLAKELWNLMAPVRGAEKNWKQVNNLLWREELLDAAAGETCPELSVERFRKLLQDVKKNADRILKP